MDFPVLFLISQREHSKNSGYNVSCLADTYLQSSPTSNRNLTKLMLTLILVDVAVLKTFRVYRLKQVRWHLSPFNKLKLRFSVKDELIILDGYRAVMPQARRRKILTKLHSSIKE